MSFKKTKMNEKTNIEEVEFSTVRDVVCEWILQMDNVDKDLRDEIENISNYQVERICGGLSNILYRVRLNMKVLNNIKLPNLQQGVAVRFYSGVGENDSSLNIFVDHNNEERIRSYLSRYGLCKKILYRFNRGQIEEWTEGRCITLDEMKNDTISNKIAENLGRLHSIKLESIVNNDHNNSQLWDRIWFWYNILMSKIELVKSIVDLNALKSRMNQIQLCNQSVSSKCVISHCDLLNGNIIISSNSNNIHFIDYEYSCIAERAFDLANHFCEMAGFQCDYSKLPDTEFRYKFYHTYLTFAVSSKLQPEANQHLQHDTMKQLDQEVQSFMSTSHLFWGLWSLLKHIHYQFHIKTSPPHDYRNYASLRLAQLKYLHKYSSLSSDQE